MRTALVFFPEAHVLIVLQRRKLVGRKPATTCGKYSSSPPTSHSTSTSSKPAPYNTHGEAEKDLPREVVAAMATLNKLAKADGDMERRVAFEEDSPSSR